MTESERKNSPQPQSQAPQTQSYQTDFVASESNAATPADVASDVEKDAENSAPDGQEPVNLAELPADAVSQSDSNSFGHAAANSGSAAFQAHHFEGDLPAAGPLVEKSAAPLAPLKPEEDSFDSFNQTRALFFAKQAVVAPIEPQQPGPDPDSGHHGPQTGPAPEVPQPDHSIPPFTTGVAAPLVLFSIDDDVVDFNHIAPNVYKIDTYYEAMGGNDKVILPDNEEAALFAGYVPGHGFHGGAGDDVIFGGGMNDMIFGDEGNDRIIGGKGADILSGGNGNDTFEWHSGDYTGSYDTIVDFHPGQDKLDISDLLIGFGPGSDIKNFAKLQMISNDKAWLMVDFDGSANGANWHQVAMLQNQDGINVYTALVQASSSFSTVLSVTQYATVDMHSLHALHLR